MEELLNKVIALTTGVKVGILAGILFVIAGGYWYFFYGDILEEKGANEVLLKRAKDEKQDYEKRKVEYLAFRNEVNQLLEEQKELLRVLPKRDDIEQFIENVNAQVELSGLSKVSSVRDKAVQEEMYLRIPIRMSLVGPYHQINRFFKNVGELQRIVTITDLSLAPVDSSRGPTANGPLKADFTAQTFQFVDKPLRRAAPAAAAPAATKAAAPESSRGAAAGGEK
jgi:type IV pilus assembly protein PilO